MPRVRAVKRIKLTVTDAEPQQNTNTPKLPCAQLPEDVIHLLFEFCDFEEICGPLSLVSTSWRKLCSRWLREGNHWSPLTLHFGRSDALRRALLLINGHQSTTVVEAVQEHRKRSVRLVGGNFSVSKKTFLRSLAAVSELLPLLPPISSLELSMLCHSASEDEIRPLAATLSKLTPSQLRIDEMWWPFVAPLLQLTNITELYVEIPYDNPESFRIPWEAFPHLTSLHVFSSGANLPKTQLFKTAHPDGCQPDLHRLCIESATVFTSTPYMITRFFPELRELQLIHCTSPSRAVDFSCLSSLQSLQAFGIPGLELSVSPVDEDDYDSEICMSFNLASLAALSRLRYFDACSCEFSPEIFESLSTRLDSSREKIGSSILFPQLQYLRAAYWKADSLLAVLRQTNGLRALSIDNAQEILGNESVIDRLRDMTSLRLLELSCEDVNDNDNVTQNVQVVSTLTQLTDLDLKGVAAPLLHNASDWLTSLTRLQKLAVEDITPDVKQILRAINSNEERLHNRIPKCTLTTESLFHPRILRDAKKEVTQTI